VLVSILLLESCSHVLVFDLWRNFCVAARTGRDLDAVWRVFVTARTAQVNPPASFCNPHVAYYLDRHLSDNRLSVTSFMYWSRMCLPSSNAVGAWAGCVWGCAKEKLTAP
jgi:hypothetical protein